MEGDLLRKNRELVESLVAGGALKSGNIIKAFMKYPRHMFVTKEFMHSAYIDAAFPTVKDSTISQPSTTAMMLEELGLKEGERVLEIGTGSGYQSCLLSECVGSSGFVTTLDIDKDVVEFARGNVKGFDVRNMKILHTGGAGGYEKDAPYDKIIYSVAIPTVPPEVLKQLKVGGRVIAPVGGSFRQVLTVVDKLSETEYSTRELGYFIFVFLKDEGQPR